MSLPVLIIGGGGHAKVLVEALRASGAPVLGITDADPARHGTHVLGVPVLGGDDWIARYEPGSVLLVNGIGSLTCPERRVALFRRYKNAGHAFASVVHPSAVVAPDVVLGEGAQVMAGAVIQPGSTICENAIINTGVSVDHDCFIGPHAHLAPGVTMSGGVRVGEGAHIGIGATLIQGVAIGNGSIVGAASLVLKDVPAGDTVIGIPARTVAAGQVDGMAGR